MNLQHLKNKAFPLQILALVLVGVLAGTVIGFSKGMRVVISNEYIHHHMFRIALLGIQSHWRNSLWLSLKITGLLILLALAIRALSRVFIPHVIEIKNPDRLSALAASTISFPFFLLLFYSQQKISSLSRINPVTIIIVLSISVLLGWFYDRFPMRGKSLTRLVELLGLISVLLFGLFNLGLYIDQNKRPSNKLNVVWIVIDSLRVDHLGSYGYSRNTSSNIDRIAAHNILFKNAFSQEAYTKASTASYFTSTYPFINRVLYTDPTFDTLDSKFVTLPELLRNEGFSTACFGYNPHLLGLNAGFQVFKVMRPRQRIGPHGFDTYETAKPMFEATRDYLESSTDRPLFLYLHYMDVHIPYAPPVPYDTMFLPAEFQSNKEILKKRSLDYVKGEEQLSADLYDGEISYTDASIHGMLNLLAEHGIDSNNTIFIFSADHGEDFFDPHPDDPGGMAHYRTLYQELIHVPLIIAAPGFPARTIENRVQLIDIVPTVLDILGIQWKQLKQFQGRSLVSLMKGNSDLKDVPILAGGNRGRCAFMVGDWKYYKFELECKKNRLACGSRPQMGMQGLSFGEQLFDIKSDPHEKTNLLVAEPERAASMRKLCASVMKSPQARKNVSIDMDENTQEQMKALGYTNQ